MSYIIITTTTNSACIFSATAVAVIVVILNVITMLPAQNIIHDHVIAICKDVCVLLTCCSSCITFHRCDCSTGVTAVTLSAVETCSKFTVWHEMHGCTSFTFHSATSTTIIITCRNNVIINVIIERKTCCR